MKDPYRVYVIGGGISGLLASCLLLSNNVNVIILERDKQLGGHWKTSYDNLGLMIEHSPRVISYNYTIFLELFKIFTRQSDLIKNNFSNKKGNSLMNFLMDKFNLIDIFRILLFVSSNLNKDLFTISVSKFLKEANLSNSGKELFTGLSNLTVAGIDETSFGSIWELSINGILADKETYSAVRSTTDSIIKPLENFIRNRGGIILTNSNVKIKYKKKNYYISFIGKEMNFMSKDSLYFKDIKVRKNERILVSVGSAVFTNPNNFLTNHFMDYNKIKNNLPVSYSCGIQYHFTTSFTSNYFSDYNWISGIYTDWAIVCTISKIPSKNRYVKFTISSVIIDCHKKSEFLGKNALNCTLLERKNETWRQILSSLNKISLNNGGEIIELFPTWITGGKLSQWTTNGLLPNGNIKYKKNRTIIWNSFLRNDVEPSAVGKIATLEQIARGAVESVRQII